MKPKAGSLRSSVSLYQTNKEKLTNKQRKQWLSILGMREVTSFQGLHMFRKNKGMLWTNSCWYILQLRWNGQILQRHKLSKLTQETIDNMKNPTPIKEIKF